MTKILRFQTLAVFTAAAFILVSCSRSQESSQKVLRLTLSDDVRTADPAISNDQVTSDLIGQIYEGLLQFSYLGKLGEIEPLIATSLPRIENQGKVLIFTLRDDVFFQDDIAFPDAKGRQVTSQDFVYSWKRIMDPRNQSPNIWMFKDMVVGFDAWAKAIENSKNEDEKQKLFNEEVKGLKTPDASTLRIELTRAFPQMIPILAMINTSVVAREVIEHHKESVAIRPIGTGPFQLQSWIQGSKVTLVRNPSYRKVTYPSMNAAAGNTDAKQAELFSAAGTPLPIVDRVEFDIIKEENPRWLKFMSGELDTSVIPKDNYSEAIGADGALNPQLAARGFKLHKTLTMTSWWIEFNLKDPTLGKNKKLRLALAHAFDRSRALELLTNNRGVLSSGPLTPFLEGGEGLPALPYSFDLEKAKALLAEAGFPGGKGLPKLSFDLRGPSVTHRQLGEFIRSNFQELGIDLEIRANSFPEALDKQKHSKFQIILGGWAGDYPDPENYLQLFISRNKAPGVNHSNFSNAEFDRLYDEIRYMLPSDKREAKIRRMVEILQQEVPVIFYFHALEYRLASKRLQNYRPNLLLHGSLKYLDVGAKNP